MYIEASVGGCATRGIVGEFPQRQQGLKVGTMLMLVLLFVALLINSFAFVPMVCFFTENSALNPVFVPDMLTHTYSHVDRPGTLVCGHTTQ